MLKPSQRLEALLSHTLVSGLVIGTFCCLSSMQVSGTNDNKKLYEWIKSQQIKSVKINCTSYLTFL